MREIAEHLVGRELEQDPSLRDRSGRNHIIYGHGLG